MLSLTSRPLPWNGRFAGQPEIVRLDARRPSAQVGEGWAFALFCLHGSARVRLGHALPWVRPGECLLSSQDAPAVIQVDRGSQAVLLRLDQSTLAEGLAQIAPLHRFEPLWITAVHHDAEALGAHLAQACGDALARTPGEGVLQDCLREALLLDQRYTPLQARCPGRTGSQRRAVLARFERTRLRFAWSESLLDADVDDLARSTSYTRWHFIRTFSAIYGDTPAEFLRETRLNWCASQLATSDLSISEIACMAGYGSHASFARAFRSHYGRSASEWRFQREAELLKKAG
ncbi:helix-turn-helix transcriptional regulator [Pseudomarimonas salicorniae]|uniref:Helix-turn-helix domain-containing protein n=1 Tax=Pseudomarimonas salicorniae TaxID=2933270 RepID=A0ABT0GE13_9GAMM|nr:helix-turn-helix transcriptional regulator [Lysobacter sp. CAU 1642]MCK7592804.1 helix-turn-helix domain-containing protein [Lysobacter sp. CAU 1642]